jgi:hypothetical protein
MRLTIRLDATINCAAMRAEGARIMPSQDAPCRTRTLTIFAEVQHVVLPLASSAEALRDSYFDNRIGWCCLNKIRWC